jgi:hypothetical protein
MSSLNAAKMRAGSVRHGGSGARSPSAAEDPRVVGETVGPRHAHMLAQLAEERQNVLSTTVGVVGQQADVQPRLAPPRPDRPCADSRDPIASALAPRNRRLALRGGAAADGGSEHEPALILETPTGHCIDVPAAQSMEYLTCSAVDGDLNRTSRSSHTARPRARMKLGRRHSRTIDHWTDSSNCSMWIPRKLGRKTKAHRRSADNGRASAG